MSRATERVKSEREKQAFAKAAVAFGSTLSEVERLEALGVDIDEARKNLGETAKKARKKNAEYDKQIARISKSKSMKRFYVRNNRSGMVIVMIAADTNDLAEKLVNTGWPLSDVVITPPDAALIPDDSSPSDYLVEPTMKDLVKESLFEIDETERQNDGDLDDEFDEENMGEDGEDDDFQYDDIPF